MPVESLAKTYFQRLTGSDAYEQLLACKDIQEEDEYLDFKRGDVDNQKNENTLSEHLSAFSNTGGGVLVLGVDTKPKNGIDVVSEFKPLDDVIKRAQYLKSRLPYLFAPPILGADVRYIAPPELEGKGFIICYAPLSQTKPHRAEKSARWLMRNRKGMQDINPFMLGYMFHPKPRYSATIRGHTTVTRDHKGKLPFSIKFCLGGPFLADKCSVDLLPTHGKINWWNSYENGRLSESSRDTSLPMNIERLCPGRFSAEIAFEIGFEEGSKYPSFTVILYIRESL